MNIKQNPVPMCLLFTLLVLPAVVQAQFTFVTNADNTITITGYTGNPTSLDIPGTTNGYPITSIGDLAFYGCTNFTSITIPNSITNIGAAAFNSCLNLHTVAIPASVTSIGDYAFFYCTNLTAITVSVANRHYSSAQGVLFNKHKTVLMQFPFAKVGSYAIPGTVTNLADEAFGINDHGNPIYSSCVGLTNLIIPGSIKHIGDHTFSHCDGLTSVKLSKGIISFGVEAFSWCSSLHSITIPDSVRNIGDLAFHYAGLKKVNIPGSVTNLGLGAFAVCSNLTTVTIQNGVTSIGEAGFNFCTDLTSVSLPDNLKSIGERAFWFCTSLTNVTIPSQVASIGLYAFSGCASLKNINVSVRNASYRSVDGVLCSKDQTTLIQFPGGRGGSYRVPNGITTIGDLAFANYDPAFYSFDYLPACANLNEIIISSNVNTIGFEDFNSLNNLTNVYFEGDAPTDPGDLSYNFNITFYYLPGTTGWDSFFTPIPAALWLPQMQSSGNNFGVRTNQFGFNINWASGQTVIVEASANLVDWQPVQTNTLATGSAYFINPQWTNYPSRFYRLRSQ